MCYFHKHTKYSSTILLHLHYVTSQMCKKTSCYILYFTLTHTYTKNTLTYTSDNQSTLMYKNKSYFHMPTECPVHHTYTQNDVITCEMMYSVFYLTPPTPPPHTHTQTYIC